jgi:hypothetical protein
MGVLTPEDLEQMAVDGYVIKHGLLDPALCRAAQDRMWELNDSRLRRDDPSSWAPFEEHEQLPAVEGKLVDKVEAEAQPRMSRRQYGFWMSSAETQVEELLLDLLPRCPAVREAAEQLLGAGRLVEPRGAAGLAEGEADAFQTGHGTVSTDSPRAAAHSGIVALL